MLKSLWNNLPCYALLKIYKLLVRPHIEYGDILYDKPNNMFFKSNLERVQYKFYPAITVATHDKCTDGIEDGFGNLLVLYKIVIIFIKTLSDY